MKIAPRQVSPFLKGPDPAIRAVLVYGPDSGLVRERALVLCHLVTPHIHDPFSTAHLTGESVEEDPARLLDELAAQSLMGGDRLIRLTAPTDSCARVVGEWLATSPPPGAFLVVEAGNLKPESKLRKLFEGADNAAALPCYVEDDKETEAFLRDELRLAGLSVSPDALSLMAASTKGDRQRMRMEIEKLALYMLSSPSRLVELRDVQASCGDAGLQSLDDLVYAALGGGADPAFRAYSRLLAEGSDLMPLQRSLQNHVARLHTARCLVDRGMSVEESLKKLKPPVFYKQEKAFCAQIRKFSAPRLRRILLRLSQIEAQTKKNGVRPETLFGDVLLKTSLL